MASVKVLGIDLWSDCSCLAVYYNGKVEIVCNEDGSRFTPSWVSFHKEKIYFGQAAKDLSITNPENTLFSIKNIIGRNYNDHQLQQDIANWPFKVVNCGGKPKLQVQYKGKTQEFYPDDILAMLLENLKEQAWKHLGEKVQDAVITVPVYFNASQQQATKISGTKAGLNLLRIISEPIAASLAYEIRNNFQNDMLILVFNFGGDTLNASILQIKSKIYMLKSTATNNNLGAEYFDTELLKYCLSAIDDEDCISADLYFQLRIECQKAIITLSEQNKAEVDINGLYNDLILSLEIYREKFNGFCNPLFEKVLEPIDRALKYANVLKYEIDKIIMVGGSTRIPRITSLVKEYFCNRPISSGVNPDEAIARGAAIYGGSVKGRFYDRSAKIKTVKLVPLSIGIETLHGQMRVIIKRNSKIPVTKTIELYTTEDYQKEVKIVIYEGERAMAVYNHILGKFNIENIKHAIRGAICYFLTFTVEESGILNIKAEEETTGELTTSSINLSKKRLPEKTIELMILDSINNHEKDLAITKSIYSLEELEYLSYMLRRVTEEVDLSKEDAQKLLSLSHKELDWIINNQHTTKETYDKRILDLTLKARPIIDNIIPEQKITHERFYKHFK